VTTQDLKKRGIAEAKRRRVTFIEFLDAFRIPIRTMRKAGAGHAINLATANRLLPLVAALTKPGEVPALECHLPDGPPEGSVILSQETYTQLRQSFFTHQSN
jgi:hypothetical protein